MTTLWSRDREIQEIAGKVPDPLFMKAGSGNETIPLLPFDIDEEERLVDIALALTVISVANDLKENRAIRLPNAHSLFTSNVDLLLTMCTFQLRGWSSTAMYNPVLSMYARVSISYKHCMSGIYYPRTSTQGRISMDSLVSVANGHPWIIPGQVQYPPPFRVSADALVCRAIHGSSPDSAIPPPPLSEYPRMP